MPRALRGANYRRAMEELTPSLIKAAAAVVANEGKLSALAVVQIANDHTLPAKTAFEFLEYAEVLPSGTYERLPPKTKAALRRMQTQPPEPKP